MNILHKKLDTADAGGYKMYLKDIDGHLFAREKILSASSS